MASYNNPSFYTAIHRRKSLGSPFYALHKHSIPSNKDKKCNTNNTSPFSVLVQFRCTSSMVLVKDVCNYFEGVLLLFKIALLKEVLNRTTLMTMKA